NNNSTVYAYDDADRLVSVTDAQLPNPGITQYTYDGESAIKSITDAQGRVTTFVYNDHSHRLSLIYYPAVAGGPTPAEGFNIDVDGNVVTYYDRSGNGWGYRYDTLDRLEQKGWPYLVNSTAYTYDLGSRLTQVQDTQTGTYRFTYDNMNRLKQTSTQYS